MRFFLLFPPLIAPLLLYAQAREDLRISPEEPYINTLPAEYRIQDADRIGNRTLVAWGTTVSAQHGYVLGSLRYQLLEGNQLLGPQRILTPPNADPYAAVQVVPLASSFLLLWSDRRADSSGLYAQSVDIDGIPVGNERRIGAEILPHSLFGTEVVILGTPEEGRLLLWQQKSGARTATYGLHVAPDGTIRDSARQVGSALERVVRFGNVPDVTLVHTTEGTLVVDRGGRIDERKVRDSLLSGPYYLEADGSLLAVRKKSLRKYRSLFVDAPEWSVPVPHLDSAAANTVMIGRDGGGNYALFFTTVSITGSQYEMGFFSLSTWRLPFTIASNILPDEPERINLQREANGLYSHPNGNLRRIGKILFMQGCDNSALISIEVTATMIYHGSLGQSYPFSKKFSLDGAGTFRDDSTGYIGKCPEARIPVVRNSAGSRITVIHAGTDSVEWDSPMASYRKAAFQTTPHIIARSDGFLCAWYEESQGGVLASLPLSPYSPAVALDTVRIDPPDVTLHGIYTIAGRETIERTEHLKTYGPLLVDVSNYSVFYDLQHVHPAETAITRTTSNALRLYTAEQDSWNPFLIREPPAVPGSGYSLTRYAGKVLGYNPEKKWLSIGIYGVNYGSSLQMNASPDTVLLIAEGKEISRLRPSHAFVDPSFWMPLDSARILLLQKDRGIVLQGNDTLASFMLPETDRQIRIVPLSSSTFLRTYGRADDLILELLTTDGRMLSEGSLIAVPEEVFADQVSVLFRPADSSIVLLWGTEADGVHAALFDKRLSVIIADTLLSATRGKALNPSGAFSGDSLFLLWEDYRNGDADIYGTALLLPSIPGTAHVADPDGTLAPLKAQLHPNPARSFVRIEFSRPLASTAELVLFDMQGASVWHGTIPPGERSATISPVEIPSGAYRLRWSARNGNGFLPLVILR